MWRSPAQTDSSESCFCRFWLQTAYHKSMLLPPDVCQKCGYNPPLPGNRCVASVFRKAVYAPVFRSLYHKWQELSPVYHRWWYLHCCSCNDTLYWWFHSFLRYYRKRRMLRLPVLWSTHLNPDGCSGRRVVFRIRYGCVHSLSTELPDYRFRTQSYLHKCHSHNEWGMQQMECHRFYWK